MSIAAVTTLGVGLSMDAFAVSLGQGAATTPAQKIRHACVLALLFGLAQATMPLLGWALGEAFHEHFASIDHWLAFILLAGLGGMMLRAGWQESPAPAIAQGWQLAALALATSVDAAAAGFTLAMLGVPVWAACALIGVITFSLTLAGTLLGRMAGERLGKAAELAGGAILIALGVKILAQHLFWG